MKIQKSIYLIIACVFISLSLSSCLDKFNEGDDSNDQEIIYDSPPTNSDYLRLMNLVNDLRLEGCECQGVNHPATSALHWNEKLAMAAQSHSDDMVENGFFSHVSPDGSTPGDRISAQGYDWTYAGENLANGFSSVDAMVDAWLDSPDHCKNLMNPNFEEFGIGRNGEVWTQDFGSRRR